MDDDQLDLIFAALADPTRRAILTRLAQGQATVNELAEPFNISQPAVSRHLRVLERAGLVTHGKEAQYRPRKLETEHLKLAYDWLDDYRRHWEESFDRLDSFLSSTRQTNDTSDSDPHDETE